MCGEVYCLIITFIGAPEFTQFGLLIRNYIQQFSGFFSLISKGDDLTYLPTTILDYDTWADNVYGAASNGNKDTVVALLEMGANTLLVPKCVEMCRIRGTFITHS